MLRPWWLLALPLLVLVAIVRWRRGADTGGWEKVIAPDMLAGLRALDQIASSPGDKQRYLSLTAATLLVLGLCGPALPRQDTPVLAQTDAILIAIDMSPSVSHGAALSDVQAAAAGILTRSAGRPVGLILYADNAYGVAAPTSDPTTLESQIAVLTAQTMPDEGSRPAAALGLAASMLSGQKQADLILISDGGGVDAATRAEAERLRAAGVRISVLAVSPTAPGAPPADEAALQTIVDGVVTPARSPQPLLALLASGGAVSRDPILAALRFLDLGPWLAGLALLPFLMLFRRRA